MGMYEVHCVELIGSLAKRADALCSKLLTRMSKDHQEANKALCEEYETIAEKALTTPANTDQVCTCTPRRYFIFTFVVLLQLNSHFAYYINRLGCKA